MSRPAAVFLDEPTSGLDASSALLVMKSLKSLCERQGVTCCSVIHQPRKFIFDLFDSLILLGVGGRTIYHGPTHLAEPYFTGLNYVVPPGENVADWLIDISSGRIESDQDESEFLDRTVTLLDNDALRETGPSGNKFQKAFEEAKRRREVLYRSWNEHFKNLSEAERERYEAPPPSPLPASATKPSFWKQLQIQLRRTVVVWRRNAFSKIIDTSLIVGAVILTTAFEGVVEVTRGDAPGVPFDALVSTDPRDLVLQFGSIFEYAIRPSRSIQEYVHMTFKEFVSGRASTNQPLPLSQVHGKGWSDHCRARWSYGLQGNH